MTSFLKNAMVSILLVISFACGGQREQTQPNYVASIEPAALILRELVRGRAEVEVLLPPGASPHTYEPKPSEAKLAADAIATFYFDDSLDAWAGKLGGSRAVAIAPGTGASEGHHHENPHVWLDPVAVRDLVPTLTEALKRFDPDGEQVYDANAAIFVSTLDKLHEELTEQFAGIDGSVIQAHASWDLFFERYGIAIVGTLEYSPGAPIAPKSFAKLTDAIASDQVSALIAEPQLSREPLETLATENTPIVELDPLGGGPAMQTYETLIRMNAERLHEALR